MELDVVMPQKVKSKSVFVHVKIVDTGSYTLRTEDGKTIAEKDGDYVPGFFPEQHYGDYLIFDIELETGRILNWVKPAPADVVASFNLGREESRSRTREEGRGMQRFTPGMGVIWFKKSVRSRTKPERVAAVFISYSERSTQRGTYDWAVIRRISDGEEYNVRIENLELDR